MQGSQTFRRKSGFFCFLLSRRSGPADDDIAVAVCDEMLVVYKSVRLGLHWTVFVLHGERFLLLKNY